MLIQDVFLINFKIIFKINFYHIGKLKIILILFIQSNEDLKVIIILIYRYSLHNYFQN